MDTEKLIQDLANGSKPVKRLRPPHVRFGLWLAGSAVYILILLLIYGLRCDCMDMLKNFLFMWETVVALGLGLAAAYLAFVLSVPGRQPRPLLRWGVVLLAAAALTTLIALTCTTPGCSPGAGMQCSLDVALFGLVPAVALIVMLTRAAPLKCVLTGTLIGIVAVAIGATAMQFVCGNSDPLHLLLWHYLPGFVFVFGGIAIANRIFRL
jgi:hypothetical protein